MEYVLTTDKLTKTYGEKKAADTVDMHVKKGEVYGLIGRNGAGKTTILKMIGGLSHPTSGSFTFLGKSGKELLKHMNKVGSLIETPGLFPKMSAFQNLKLKCLSLGKNDDAYINSLLERVGLAYVGNKPTQSFSLGMKQRLGIALALVGNPELIILDEPINGLDPQGIAEMRGIINGLSKELGMTVIVSSHILDELVKVADSFGIINDGKLIDEFSTEELNKRCTKHLLLRTCDQEKAITVLKNMNLNDFELVDDDLIKILSAVEDSSQLVCNLVNQGVRVYELSLKQVTLEEYYLTRTGRTV